MRPTEIPWNLIEWAREYGDDLYHGDIHNYTLHDLDVNLIQSDYTFYVSESLNINKLLKYFSSNIDIELYFIITQNLHHKWKIRFFEEKIKIIFFRLYFFPDIFFIFFLLPTDQFLNKQFVFIQQRIRIINIYKLKRFEHVSFFWQKSENRPTYL